jgi:hypothetical protein
VICDAAAAGSAAHTSKFLTVPPLAVVLVEVLLPVEVVVPEDAVLAVEAGAPPEHAAAAAVSRTRPAPASTVFAGPVFPGPGFPGTVFPGTRCPNAQGTRMAAPGWVSAGGTQAERTPVVFPLLS